MIIMKRCIYFTAVIMTCLLGITRIRGQVPDSCLSCEFSIFWEGFEFIK